MDLLCCIIKPFEGLNEIKLYDSLNDVKKYLKNNEIKYNEEFWDAKEETVPNPWTVLFVENCINLYFASNNKLFKIYCTNGFKGSLPNGINLNTSLEEAKNIDKTLKYDDEGEDFESEQGYWIENNLENGNVYSITVYIKEILDNRIFDNLEW